MSDLLHVLSVHHVKGPFNGTFELILNYQQLEGLQRILRMMSFELYTVS